MMPHTEKILLLSVAEPVSHFGSLRQLLLFFSLPFITNLLLVSLLLLITVTSITEKQKPALMRIKLTMLFIFEEDELALCFRRLLSSSVFPSLGFMISRLPPAVPSEEDLRRFSTNLPSLYGLKLLARSTTNRETISNQYRELTSTNIFLMRTLLCLTWFNCKAVAQGVLQKADPAYPDSVTWAHSLLFSPNGQHTEHTTAHSSSEKPEGPLLHPLLSPLLLGHFQTTVQ